MTDSINFIETRFHYLSPFSAHPVRIWGENFATVEHAYQAARIKAGKFRNEVKNAPSPLESWRRGQLYKNDPSLRVEDFDKIKVMEQLLRAKAAQHPEIVEILRESGDRTLLKNYDTDYFWGTGKDGSGKNLMGKIWMKIREELKSDAE